MSVIVLASILINRLAEPRWTKATTDNGVFYYHAAARLVESPGWKGFVTGRPERKKLDLLRHEAAPAAAIFEDLKKGNALPSYDPVKIETLDVTHPEYSLYRKVCWIACDVAYVKAVDGDLESASQWLIQADRFCRRLPTPGMISLEVNQAMLHGLRETTRELLPRFGPRQLNEQAKELESIASNPLDLEAAAHRDLQVLNRSIPRIVEDPAILGLRDDPPDASAALDKAMAMKEPSPALSKVLERIFNAAPPDVRKNDDAALKYLSQSEAQVPTEQLAEYRKFVEVLESAVRPATYKLSTYGRSLDAASRAHAVNVLRLACDPPLKALIAALRRPEKSWWKPWVKPADPSLNKQMMLDGALHQFQKVDLYALQLSAPVSGLTGTSQDDPATDLRRYFLLEREKARLAVVDVKIRIFEVAHHRLPTSLEQIGSPRDPLSHRVFGYRRTSSTSYELAAVGIPEIARIDESTAVPLDLNSR